MNALKQLSILCLALSFTSEASAQNGSEPLTLLGALEAHLAFDLPPSDLQQSPEGKVIAAEMWHAHARNYPGKHTGRCHGTKSLRNEASISIAGPAALGAAACEDGVQVGIPELLSSTSEIQNPSRGHIRFYLKQFNAHCIELKRPSIHPKRSELLVRTQGAVWLKGHEQEAKNAQDWTSVPWPDGMTKVELCVLPTALENDLWVALRNTRIAPKIELGEAHRLLRSLLQSNRDRAQYILESNRSSETTETFSWIRRAVRQEWPALIHVNPGSSLPVLADSETSRRIASHLAIRIKLEEGDFSTALSMVRSRMNHLGNSGHYLKARSLEGLGWEFEARETITDALTGLYNDCRIRTLAKSLNVEVPPILGTCLKDHIYPEQEANDGIQKLSTSKQKPLFHAFLNEAFTYPDTRTFKAHATLIVGYRYWVDLHATGNSTVFRRSLYKVNTPRGAVSVQHWAADTDWKNVHLIRMRPNTPPEFGHTVEGNDALLLDDVQPGDEVEVLQIRHQLADAYLGPGSNFERLACSDRVYPVGSCTIHIHQDASAEFPLRLNPQALTCERSESGHLCTGGPYKPAPKEAEPGSPWSLIAHLEVAHDVPANLALKRSRTLVKSALLSARPLKYYGAYKSLEELHRLVREAPRRSPSSPEASFGLNPKDIDLLKALESAGHEAFLAQIPDMFGHDPVFGKGTRRIVVPRDPEFGSIWWTTSLALPFGTLIPALDQGRPALNLGPNINAQRLKTPVVESTGGLISIESDLSYNEDNRSIAGTVRLKWTGVFAFNVARSQQGIEASTAQWVNLLLPGLNAVGELDLYFNENESSIEVEADIHGSDIRPEQLAIQMAHPQALAGLLHHKKRTSKLYLAYGMKLEARMTVEHVKAPDLETRSEIKINGNHAKMGCTRRYISNNKVDLRCTLNLPATQLSPKYWSNLRESLGQISDHQRVPLID